MKYKPVDKGFECFSDADFVGNYLQETALDDPATARSRSGCIDAQYVGSPNYRRRLH
jgi:hypothetical protein